MKRGVVFSLILGMVVFNFGTAQASFTSLSTVSNTASVTFTGLGQVDMEVSLIPARDGADTSGGVTWELANVQPGTGWKYADQVIKIDGDLHSQAGWGIQIYTRNPDYTGGIDHAGLLNQSDKSKKLPMCWKIMDSSWTATTPAWQGGSGPQDPVEVADPADPTLHYFSNNYLWFKDDTNEDDPNTPEDEAWENADDYATIWNEGGIKYGGAPEERGGGEYPVYIYLGANFRDATTSTSGVTYSTTIYLEKFYQ